MAVYRDMGIYDGEGAMRTMERGSIKNKWYNEETHRERCETECKAMQKWRREEKIQLGNKNGLKKRQT